MERTEDALYATTERQIRRSTRVLVLLSFAVVGVVWALLFVRETAVRFGEERAALVEATMGRQRAILRERVDAVVDLIVHWRKQARERYERALREGGSDAPVGLPDEIEARLQEQLLDLIARLRYGENYIFIDTFDGYALLMNGERLDPPLYAWNLEDEKGNKILQEQLKVALADPGGGFLSYSWNEVSLGRAVPYLSFFRAIRAWKWKIGTGMYVERIEGELAAREAALWTRTWLNVLIASAVVATVLLIVLLAAVRLSRRVTNVMAALRTSLDASRESLLDLNATLEERVREETERRVALHELSMTDGLTGVANRRRFDATLETEWRRGMRLGRPVSLLFADVDHLKAYNDRHGHRHGDEALVCVARALAGALGRGGDLVARYGGDEFAAILPETDLEGARRVGRRLVEAVEGLASGRASPGDESPLSISVGVACRRAEVGLETSVLVEAADRALYRAKRGGRGRVEVDDPPAQRAPHVSS